MAKTFALDVCGTLIDPHAIAASLETHVGEQAAKVSETWRSNQLEYSFRRGLMRVYHHFANRTGAATDAIWLVSSNPFDIIGARSVGWQAAWVRRNPKVVFDPFEFEPSKVVTSLQDLVDL